MLRFFNIDEIKDCAMAIITPASAIATQATLNAINTDIGDYHLDHKRWWQASNNKIPAPTSPPKYGKAYPRINYKIVNIISRQLSTSYEVYVGPGGPSDLLAYDGDIIIQGLSSIPPPPAQPCGAEGVVFVDFPATSDRGITTSLSPIDAQPSPPPPPPGGYYTVYWRTYRGRGYIDCGTGVLIMTELPIARYGSYTVSPDAYNPTTEQRTTSKNEFIDNHKVARLGYFSFIDGKVLRKGIGAASDPQPTSAPLWKGAWNSTTNYKLSDIVSRSIGASRTYFCIRSGKNKPPESNPTWWERCNRPKTQVVSGCGVSHSLTQPVTVSQFKAGTLGATGAQTYLFPGRNDIRPLCGRVFLNSNTQRNFKENGDVFGIQVNGVPGYGSAPYLVGDPNFNSGAPISFQFTLGTQGRWNGIANVITNSVLTTGDDDGIAQFLIRVNTWSQSQAVEVTVDEVT